MTTDAAAVGKRSELLSPAMLAVVQGRAGLLVAQAVGSPHAQLPALGPLVPQLTASSQFPAADKQDPHLPPGTAATGAAVLTAPNVPHLL